MEVSAKAEIHIRRVMYVGLQKHHSGAFGLRLRTASWPRQRPRKKGRRNPAAEFGCKSNTDRSRPMKNKSLCTCEYRGARAYSIPIISVTDTIKSVSKTIRVLLPVLYFRLFFKLNLFESTYPFCRIIEISL